MTDDLRSGRVLWPSALILAGSKTVDSFHRYALGHNAQGASRKAVDLGHIILLNVLNNVQ